MKQKGASCKRTEESTTTESMQMFLTRRSSGQKGKERKGKTKESGEKRKALEGKRGRQEGKKRENDISKQITTVNTHFPVFSHNCLDSEIFFLTLPFIHF